MCIMYLPITQWMICNKPKCSFNFGEWKLCIKLVFWFHKAKCLTDHRERKPSWKTKDINICTYKCKVPSITQLMFLNFTQIFFMFDKINIGVTRPIILNLFSIVMSYSNNALCCQIYKSLYMNSLSAMITTWT